MGRQEHWRTDEVPGDETAGHETAGHETAAQETAAHELAQDGPASRVSEADPAESGDRPARLGLRRLRGAAGRWLSIFTVSLGLFIVRFLVPAPVGQADNRDGPRLMCGLGVAPVTHGFARFFRYAYFEYVPSKACAGRLPYPSSALVPLELARLVTPVLRLPGTL